MLKPMEDQIIEYAGVRLRYPGRRERRRLRRRANLTQAQVAAAIGVSRIALAKYERGDRIPRNPKVLTRYVRFLERLADLDRGDDHRS